MGLLKFRAFNKMLKEIKSEKDFQKRAEEYKKVYLERLTAYGAKDASELNDEQLDEFLEGMKSYRKKQISE
jgi:adenylate kinase family enzyme